MTIPQEILDAAANYKLVPADLHLGTGYSDTPAIRAASNPDSPVLIALLRHWSQRKATNKEAVARLGPNGWQWAPAEGSYNCPLQAAITTRNKLNIEILLKAEAETSGFPVEVFSEFAGRLVRFRPLPRWRKRNSPAQASSTPPAELGPLTADEIEVRAQEGCISPFWTAPDLPYISMQRDWVLWELITPLEHAVRTGDLEIVNTILAYEPDVEAWLLARPPGVCLGDPGTAKASWLSHSTPLHSAATYHQNHVLLFLLDKGFEPNVQPAASPCCALTPLMASVVADPPNREGFDLLASHQFANPHRQTPVFEVHVFHFIVAQLELSLLKHAMSILPTQQRDEISSQAAIISVKTALSHSLLHVACLPASDTQVNWCSDKIWQSIHDVRSTDRMWQSRFAITTRDRNLKPISKRQSAVDLVNYPDPEPPMYFEAQTAIVEYLLESLSEAQQAQLVAAQDVYGNTAMHYLAAYRTANEDLVAALKAYPDGEETWNTSRNRWGHTPAVIHSDGSRTLAEKEQEALAARQMHV